MSDFAYRMIMEKGRMTTNEIWAAAQESETRIAHSENTNQISNRLRVSPLFTQHGTVRQRSARGAVSGGSIPGTTQRVGNFSAPDAHFHSSPLWDITDLDTVAEKYLAKTHKVKVHRLPAILRNRIRELMSDE